jgi:SAM-dependent methyltransferase
MNNGTMNDVDNWDRHWQEIGQSSEMGPTPKYRRRLIFKLLGIDAQDDSVRLLEIGSGTGEFAEEFCRRYPRARILGLELSRFGVEIAARRAPTAVFLQRDLMQPAQPDAFQEFGATYAICSEVLEHVDDPVVLLRNAAPYLSPGSKLIVTVPGGPINAFYKHIGHRRHYSPRDLGELLEQAGFHVEQLYAAGFPFFNLFRMFITWRGDALIKDVTGPPSRTVRFGMWVVDMLLRFNLMRWGWQTIGVARFRGNGIRSAVMVAGNTDYTPAARP